MDKKIVLRIVSALIIVSVFVSIYVVYSANNDIESSVIEEDEYLYVSDEILILSGWIGSETINMMAEPSDSSEIIGSIGFNEQIEYTIYNDNWYKIYGIDVDAYVPSEYILDEDTGYSYYEQYDLDKIAGYTDYNVPITSGFKSYMDYRTITSKESKQYKLQNEYAYTGDYGIRMVGDRHCVALGSYFTSDIGQYFDLILTDGTIIQCILADQKADIHTDSNNIITMHNNCMSEFVIDTQYLYSAVKSYGDVSQCEYSWRYPVKTVRVYNKNIFD